MHQWLAAGSQDAQVESNGSFDAYRQGLETKTQGPVVVRRKSPYIVSSLETDGGV